MHRDDSTALAPADKAAVETALAKPPAERALAPFTPQTFEQFMEVARMVSESGIVQRELQQKPGACAALMMRGAKLGLDWATAVTEGYVVHGRVAWPAAIIAAAIETSPAFEYFEVVEASNESATVEAKKHTWAEAKRYTVTLEDARAMGFMDGKHSKLWTGPRPMQMLVAMVRREAGRLWDPVRCAGLYSPEELALGFTEERPQIQQPRSISESERETRSGAPANGNGSTRAPIQQPRRATGADAPLDLEAGKVAARHVPEEAWREVCEIVDDDAADDANRAPAPWVDKLLDRAREAGWSNTLARSAVAAYVDGIFLEALPKRAVEKVVAIFDSFPPQRPEEE